MGLRPRVGRRVACCVRRLRRGLVIVNRILMLAVVAVLLPVIGCSAPDVRPSSAIFDELMHKSGLWIQLAQVEPMMQAGVSQAHAKSGQLSEQDLERLRKAIATTYAPDDLRMAARNQLPVTLAQQDAATVLRWLSSDLGRRITALEEGGRVLTKSPRGKKRDLESLRASPLRAGNAWNASRN